MKYTTEARIEHDRALQRGMIAQLSDHTELSRQFGDNHSFKKWLSDTFFCATYPVNGNGWMTITESFGI